jgi:NADPH:quinone reductase-like Zn-dependent oxidoreductase
MERMRAAVYERYGPPEVVSVRMVSTPEPRSDEIRIRVHAATVTAADWRIRSRTVPRGFGVLVRLVFGWSRPRQGILGTDAAGVVDAVGANVTRWTPGQRVVVAVGARMGCHAEYVCVRQDAAIAPIPEGMAFDQAAALCFGGTTALHFLRKGHVREGERVVIVGAAGNVGSAAVQLAKDLGAQVTGVCGPHNLDVVRSLGAHEAIDYTRQDFTRNGQRYDVIMDTTGTAPYARCRQSLAPGGRLLAVLADLPQTLLAPWVGLTTDTRVVTGTAAERAEDLRTLADLATSGRFTPLIGARVPLAHIVEAHRLADSGHKRGSVVVSMAGD